MVVNRVPTTRKQVFIWRDHGFNFGPKLATRVTKFRELISKVGGKLWRREGYLNGNFCDITKSTWGSTSVKAKKCIYKPRLPRYPNFSLDYNQMQRNSDCIIHCGFTPKGHQQGVLEICWFGDDGFVCLRLVYSYSAWPRNAAQDDKLSIMETN